MRFAAVPCRRVIGAGRDQLSVARSSAKHPIAGLPWIDRILGESATVRGWRRRRGEAEAMRVYVVVTRIFELDLTQNGTCLCCWLA
jgi:hypothetical protein